MSKLEPHWAAMFARPGPLLVERECGNEPSLAEIIQHYYASHDCKHPRRLTQQYIEAWLRESLGKDSTVAEVTTGDAD